MKVKINLTALFVLFLHVYRSLFCIETRPLVGTSLFRLNFSLVCRVMDVILNYSNYILLKYSVLRFLI